MTSFEERLTRLHPVPVPDELWLRVEAGEITAAADPHKPLRHWAAVAAILVLTAYCMTWSPRLAPDSRSVTVPLRRQDRSDGAPGAEKRLEAVWGDLVAAWKAMDDHPKDEATQERVRTVLARLEKRASDFRLDALAWLMGLRAGEVDPERVDRMTSCKACHLTESLEPPSLRPALCKLIEAARVDDAKKSASRMREAMKEMHLTNSRTPAWLAERTQLLVETLITGKGYPSPNAVTETEQRDLKDDIKALGAEEYAEREAAFTRLLSGGGKVEQALWARLKDRDREVSSRIAVILGVGHRPWNQYHSYWEDLMRKGHGKVEHPPD